MATEKDYEAVRNIINDDGLLYLLELCRNHYIRSARLGREIYNYNFADKQAEQANMVERWIREVRPVKAKGE